MVENTKYRVIDLTPDDDEAMKPSELIQSTGHSSLSLYARRAITVLWHNAHAQGVEKGRIYSIELARLRSGSHRGLKPLEEAIESLMTTILVTRLGDGTIRRVQFLGGNDMVDSDRPSGILRYSFDPMLIEILRDSSVWGRIALPILMSFSSKYSISLYERICQFDGLSHKTYIEYTLEEMRDALGVEGGKYSSFGDLNKNVLKPAVDEINALARFNLTAIPVKEARRVVAIRVAWWPKSEDELKGAFKEANASKVGRRARITGRVEHVEPVASISTRERREQLSLIEDD